MDSADFLRELDQSVSDHLRRIAENTAAAEPGESIGIPELLATALRKELEASEEAAMWMTSENDVEVKLALARQCGDEAKHYRLIEERLRQMGARPHVERQIQNPLEGGYSPMFAFLKSLESTVERVAAGQFTREALAKVHNQAFIDYCEAKGDADTARLYRDIIQPDEGYHHELGRKLLARLAITPEAQEKARKAAARTLEIAEEIQEISRLKKGIAKAPGC
ncbi:MAG: ferritin-like domain-containing protein [Polyangiaceae bacterium]|nr:ferritin-like domain-containing protein [Polyangiaceae bacterium]NUQ79753.1 ferritin-like domain-containing protein [Polyangiaceae bacterium]